MTRSRREFLASTAALLAGGAPFIARRRFQLFGWSTTEYSERAIRLVQNSEQFSRLDDVDAFSRYRRDPCW